MSSQTILIEISGAGVERVTSYIKAAALLAELEPAIHKFDKLIQKRPHKKAPLRLDPSPTAKGNSTSQ